MKYPSKTLVKSITPVPRSVSEANRDAQYACAIQTFKSDSKLTLDFLANMFIGAVWTAIAIAGAVAIFAFITGWRF